MSKIADRLREYVNGLDIGEHYGKWGALRLDQRRDIRKLCDACDTFEQAADLFCSELQAAKIEIERLEGILNTRCGHCPRDNTTLVREFAERLKEKAKANEWNGTICGLDIDNLVIVPPMKLGQICFEPCGFKNEADECRVSSITQKADGTFKIRLTNLREKWVFEINEEDIGETVFLTKEETERVLKERDNNAE